MPNAVIVHRGVDGSVRLMPGPRTVAVSAVLASGHMIGAGPGLDPVITGPSTDSYMSADEAIRKGVLRLRASSSPPR